MASTPEPLGRTMIALGLLACAAAALAVLGWINYDLLTEAYGSGPPHYGRTANMDKWSSPFPGLLIFDLVGGVLVLALARILPSPSPIPLPL